MGIYIITLLFTLTALPNLAFAKARKPTEESLKNEVLF